MTWVKRILGALFVLLVLVLLVYAYQHFVKSTRKGDDPMKAVPPSAGLALRTKDPAALWDKLQETNIVWENLVKEGTLAGADSTLSMLDTLAQEDERLKAFLDGSSLAISLHSVGSRSVGLQFTFGLKGSASPEKVMEGVKDAVEEFQKREYEGELLYESGKGDNSTAFARVGRTFIFSRSVILVEDAVRHLKNKDGIAEKEGYRKVEATTGTGMDAHLFIHYPTAERILSKFLEPGLSKRLKEGGDQALWTGADLLLRSKSLLFTGFTDHGKKEDSYLSSLQGQEPRSLQLPRALPARTAFFNALGLSDVGHYLERYTSYIEGKNRGYDREKKLSAWSDSCDCKVPKKATSWIGGELAGVYLEPSEEASLKENALIAIRTFDRDASLRSLRELAAKGKADPLEEGIPGQEDVPLYRLPMNGLYRTLFGKGFPKLEAPYFIVLQDHVFLSEKKGILRELLRDRELGRTLGQDVDFDSFTDELSHRSNLLIYANIGRSPYLLTEVLDDEYVAEVKDRIDLMRRFQGIGVQFSSRKPGRLYSNIYLEYDPVYKKETASLWEAPLDTSIRSKPYLVKNHYNEALEAFVQDVSDRVYLVSNTGEVLWKKQLGAPIIGEVRQVDVYKNGKLQLLFNTRNEVHLLDRKGRYVEGFPIQLPEPATAPMALFDYANDKRYRILVPCADNKVHYYDKHGKELEGWNFEGTETPMQRPPQHIRIDKKDYILVTDSAGEVLLLNRRGKPRYEVEERIGPSKHTPLVVTERKSIGASSITFTDTTGAVVEFRFEGKRTRDHFKEGMEEPIFFDHQDLENDGKKEYILLQGQELMVHGADKEQRFGYTFDSTITTPPVVAKGPKGKGKVGVLDRKNAEAYLFDRSGSLHEGFPLFGTTPFSVGDINKDGYLELVIGSEEGTLYGYSLN